VTDDWALELGDIEAVDHIAKIGDIAAEARLRQVELVAWRDLDHPEAGGSELHAARIAERWAAAGLDVTVTASRSPGSAGEAFHDGYRVRRPAGRYGIFPLVGTRRLLQRRSAPDATVEIWNGMPFFSPLWSPRRLVFLHHVHDAMWELVLPKHLARLGRFLECRLAPPIYRSTPIVTLSESSRQAILEILKLDPDQVAVVPPGVDDSFSPGGQRSPVPLVAAVGRLVPYKRFDRLIEVLVRLRRSHPSLRAVIAGEGSERAALEELIANRGAQDWIQLPGRVGEEDLVDLYRRAWVLVSTSAYEGWGMTISEAAACATPAVVSPIAGHTDAVEHGVTGFLAEPGPDMEQSLDLLLRDQFVLRPMQKAAHERSLGLTWDRTALETMRALAATTPAESRNQPGR
jgi:glycosyltransferase involved in cell wall biosynthesis